MSDPVSDAIRELDDLQAFGEHGEEEEAAAIPLPNAPPFRILKGKYKDLVLPRMISVKPSYYDNVKAIRNEIECDTEFQRHASSIAWTYADLRREVEQKAEELAEARLRLAAVMLLMIDQFEIEGQTAVTLANRDTIRVNVEPHLIVTDKEPFRLWCLQQGFERLMVLPWGTANRHVKEMLVGGLPEPPGACCYARPKVTFSRGDRK